MLIFIFYSHLKMTSERSTRRGLLSLIFITKCNHETFLEIYFAKINNIFPASNRLLTKITQEMFSETFKHTYNYQEKMEQVFHPRSLNRALSKTHPELILEKIVLNREMLCL